MNKWDKQLEEFIGRDKVTSIEIYQGKNGKWFYKYRERVDGKTKYDIIELPDRETAEKYHFQFGGKNPSTVSCPDKFTKLGKWRAEDVRVEGHKITQLQVTGMRQSRDKKIPLMFPEGCGHPYLISKKKQTVRDVKLILKDKEEINIFRAFKNSKEFDQFVSFLFSNDLTRGLTFYVNKIVFENTETFEAGEWQRCRAKDGTNRMILELRKIDGVKYQELMYKDILYYADGLANAECRKIPKGKKVQKEEVVCYFAAKEGRAG